MLLQTNSYIVPKEKRAEHARLLQRFRQTLRRLGCEQFEVYEQVGAHWSGGQTSGRFVQIMRFTDRRHQQEVQRAEEADPAARQLIAEFCDLINFPYQQHHGLFASGYYQGVLSAPRQEAAAGEGPGASNGSAVGGVKPAYRPADAVRPEPRKPVTPQAMGAASPPAAPPQQGDDAPPADPAAPLEPEVVEPDWLESAGVAAADASNESDPPFVRAGDTVDEDPDDSVAEEVEMELYLDEPGEADSVGERQEH